MSMNTFHSSQQHLIQSCAALNCKACVRYHSGPLKTELTEMCFLHPKDHYKFSAKRARQALFNTKINIFNRNETDYRTPC